MERDNVSITLRFDIIDQQLFDKTVDKLLKIESYQRQEQLTLAERVEKVATNMDILALEEGVLQGWNDVGLERLD